jgi:acyl-CoA hydrolase
MPASGDAEDFDHVAEGFQLVSRHTVMYPDCNVTNRLFGGRLMQWIDDAAGMFVRCNMGSDHVVTAQMDQVRFRRPTQLGEIIEIYCKVTRFGRTSLSIALVVTNLDVNQPSAKRKKLETQMVWVNVDEQGRPCAYEPSPVAMGEILGN